MHNNTIRVVIDTNIWISFLIGKSLIGLTDAIITNRVLILFSDKLFKELSEVLTRPKFKKYFSASTIETLIAILHEKVELIDIADLLILNPFHNIEIISYKMFQNIIDTQSIKIQ